MNDKLAELANALDQDPALQRLYIKDPKKVLEEFGVSEDDIKLVLGDDMKALKSRLDMSGMKATVTIKNPD